MWTRILVCLLVIAWLMVRPSATWAQYSNERSKAIAVGTDTLVYDSLSTMPGSFKATISNGDLDTSL
ncbi:MAG: hypothetical protein JNM00_16270, partial [Flavobacteriales bacterium]|nr:hypothetical protein [Flavobacteriales bacterium]